MNNFSRLDLEKRERFAKKELRLIQLKTLRHDLSLPKAIRNQAQYKLSSLAQSSKMKMKNRCVISSRGKAVYRKLGISRIMLRELGHQGLVQGVSKASW